MSFPSTPERRVSGATIGNAGACRARAAIRKNGHCHETRHLSEMLDEFKARYYAKDFPA
jgi:hypothetical protein